jgi:hypothetical protein
MMMARTELFRRKISQQGSDAVSDTEQKEALKEAQRRLHSAEEKVAVVKKLIPIFHHAMAEYISHATPLADHLTGGMERSIATLERMVVSLEQYLALQVPTAPRVNVAGEAAGAEMTSARVGGSSVEPGHSHAQASEDSAQGEENPREEQDASQNNPAPEPNPTVVPSSKQEHDS